MEALHKLFGHTFLLVRMRPRHRTQRVHLLSFRPITPFSPHRIYSIFITLYQQAVSHSASTILPRLCHRLPLHSLRARLRARCHHPRLLRPPQGRLFLPRPQPITPTHHPCPGWLVGGKRPTLHQAAARGAISRRPTRLRWLLETIPSEQRLGMASPERPSMLTSRQHQRCSLA